MKHNLVRIHEADNVAITLTDLSKGDRGTTGRLEVTIANDVPFSHKVALKTILSGSEIIKYGESIGNASRDIVAGEWVHTHNITIEETIFMESKI